MFLFFLKKKALSFSLFHALFILHSFVSRTFLQWVIFAYLHSNGLLTDFIFIWGTFKIQVLALEKRKDSSDYLN